MQKVFGPGRRYAYIVLTEERALTEALGKMRRLRRLRRLSGVLYWAAWAVAGIVFLLLLVGGVVGLASA